MDVWKVAARSTWQPLSGLRIQVRFFLGFFENSERNSFNLQLQNQASHLDGRTDSEHVSHRYSCAIPPEGGKVAWGLCERKIRHVSWTDPNTVDSLAQAL